MPDSANKVLHEITQAGLLSSDQVTKYDRELDTGADALLKRLIDEGHITSYQADKFRLGLASDISFGDYLVMDKLGQGGMGTVLLAKHRRMDRKVAIKILPVTALESEAAVARFYQEVKVAAQLTHPNIVHAYDAGEQNGFHYLVMEYVAGHDLANVIYQLGSLPINLAVDYILQAALGLEYAHRKGVVHRDIKPSNLLLDDEGVVKVLDMGLARISGQTIGDSQVSMHLTTTGQVMGTVEYMSPEQAEDTRLADARSDIYSLGCTLYRMISGKSHFSRDTVVKTILAHRDADRPNLVDEFRGLVDDREATELNRILGLMLAKNPDNRYQTTVEMLEDLRRFRDQLEGGFVDPPARENVSPDMPTIAPNSRTNVPPAATTDDIPIIPASQVNRPPSAMTEEITYINEPVVSASEPASVAPAAPPSQPPASNVIPRYSSAIPNGFVAPVLPGQSLVKKHRGKRLIGLSIGALIFVGYTFGVVFGIMTWVFANSDIDEMEKGTRDSTGKNLTVVAKVIGIITVVVSAIVIIGRVAT